MVNDYGGYINSFADNAVYDHPEVHHNRYSESTGTFLSQPSTYEIPLNTSNRNTMQSLISQSRSQQPQGWTEEGTNIYSTIDSNGNNRAASREEELVNSFADSFETEYHLSQEGSDQVRIV